MTVREIYDRGIRDLPVPEQLRLASFILDELSRSETVVEQELRDRIRLATPPNAVLMNAATTHGPPQDWWNSDDDPTASSGGD
ncbi:MAG TPA: hypothetical protein VG326_03765 [Tepidisphaeraceae bacterium]|jgi:hypothetical protein|nr:hypothetical protein [Tepidisphaeraceae bacterium]